MSVPFFYINTMPAAGTLLELNDENARHALQVLRMKAGEQLMLTDGLGNASEACLETVHKRHASVRVGAVQYTDRQVPRTSIAISPLKNTGRLEWFLEKATELGVSDIIPLICRRTEKQKLRTDRLEGIIRSAMLQSQQYWKPVLHEPLAFHDLLAAPQASCNLIAHCVPGENKSYLTSFTHHRDVLICIGPEGDFTEEEIGAALLTGFHPVTLGQTRLRTETAALAAAVWLAGRQAL